jgi:hypothetical protein
MFNDVGGASAEATSGTERTSKRANEHVDLGGIDVLGFCETATCSAHDAERPGLVEHEAEFVAEFELNLLSLAMPLKWRGGTYQFGQINTISHCLEQPLSDNESSSQRFLGLLLHNLLQDSLQVLHIVVLIVPNRTPADLKPFSNSIIDRPIRNNDIASLAERRNDTRDRRESLRINNAPLSTQARSNVRLRLHVYILRAVEKRRAAGSNTICA